MKKSGLIPAIIICVIAACSSCSNVCQDPHSSNFNQTGTCIDATGGVIGTYTGMLRDSVGGVGSSYAVQLKISKLNNSNVSVQLVSPAGAPFTPFTALVFSSASGNSMAVNSDSINHIIGAGTAYASAEDGIYLSTYKQIYLYVETNTNSNSFESFVGIKQ